MASVSERVRWKTIRRGRLRRALTAVRERRIADVFAELDHPAAVEDAAARVLHAIATLMGSPTPANAERCVTELENAEEERDPEALTVAVPVLERVLFQGPGHSLDRVAGVARLTERLTRLTGPLPWGHYNLAVHALRTGQFGAAVRHLSAGAASPVGGWPLPLLGAACAAVLGDPAALAGSLTQPIRDSDVFHDHRLLFGIHTFFERLRADRPIEDPAQLAEAFGGPDGPLTRAVPQLAALKDLLAAAVRVTAPAAELPGLDGCLWGRWLADRLRHARADVLDVLAGSVVTGTEPPALLWQRLGTQQDLQSMVAEEAARELPKHLTTLAAPVASLPVWAALVAQRIRLTGRAEDTPQRDHPPAPCPWWPPAGVLQSLAQRENRIEAGYLTGRTELRLGRPIPARRWFGTGRDQLAGPGLATRLIALRFGPLVEYWDGVALAHQGRAEDATAQLRACVGGVKDRDAKAQLGLLAVAADTRDEAERLLAQVADPRPASADYLAALLTSETADLVDRVERRATAAGPYRTAAHRLAGRVHEAKGDLADADRHYRTALEHDPADRLAARRLVRVWTRQRYTDKSLATQPLPDAYWSDVDESLPVVRTCLDRPDAEVARAQLADPPADPALRLLVVRHAIVAREADAAAEAIREWTAGDDPDPRLVVAARAIRGARAVREFCRTGEDDARADLTALAAEPAAAPDGGDPDGDPVVGFWLTAAKALLDPTAATLPAGDDLPAPMRLFAGALATFSADADVRRDGAAMARTALADASPKDPAARAAAECLIADALGEDGRFLLAYKEIETEDGLAALPWDLAASYLAAVEARLRVGELGDVVDGFIPDSLADLAAPGVRRAMGVAYARRAVKLADGDARAALRDLDQARDLLREAP